MIQRGFVCLRFKALVFVLLALVLAAGCGATASKSSGAQASAQDTLVKNRNAPPYSESLGESTPLEPAAVPIQASVNGSTTPAPPTKLNDMAGISPSWQALILRLKQDLPDAPVDTYFTDLADYSTMPMAVKIKELYTAAFVRKQPKPDDGTPKPPPSMIYRGIVTTENMAKCQTYLATHQAAFATLEQRYKVPKETVVSLLLVETKLGTYLGSVDAFWSLACMAASDAPEKVKPGLTVDITPDKESWLKAKLDDKSAWAYNELKALINHCAIQTLNPQGMPGSVYGAVGICQFMPSNLSRYTDDGDGDGKVDLFNEADAIVSVGKYLTAHGWQVGGNVAHQRSVLKRYNNSTRYANTIITMAHSLTTGTLHSAPPDAPARAKSTAKATPAKGTPAKKGAAKKSSGKKP